MARPDLEEAYTHQPISDKGLKFGGSIAEGRT